MMTRRVGRHGWWVLAFLFIGNPALGAEKLVGLQSAPSIAMALP